MSSKRLKKYFEPDKLTKKKVNLYQYNTTEYKNMRRKDIQLALKNIGNIVEKLNLIEIISLTSMRGEEGKPESFLDAMNKFSIAYSNFQENEKKIIEAMGLEGLLDPKLWALSMNSDKNNLREKIWPLRQSLFFITDYFPKLNSVFSQEYLDMFRD